MKETQIAVFLLGVMLSAPVVSETPEPSETINATAKVTGVPVFSADQVEHGKAAYAASCARCHGRDMEGSNFAPPLRGIPFLQHWAGRPVSDLFSKVTQTMPPGNAGTLPSSVYVQIIANILEASGVRPGSQVLPADSVALSTMEIPGKRVLGQMADAPTGPLSPGIALPPWPHRPTPLEEITPVREALLDNPPEGDWLSWRRTRDDAGFSPLRQITKHNVHKLHVAWTLALPAGPNESTPLVHDGVIFVPSFGDHIQALDATTGDELWHYSRQLPQGAAAMHHRNIALYQDKVILGTSDTSVVSLDARTGRVIWETSIGDFRTTYSTGGPLVASGVVMQGVGGGPGGGYIVGLDAATGKTLWRVNTIPSVGEPNANSWNGEPAEKRSGAGVWTAGSYDADSRLAYFGTGNTYDTGPLLPPIKQAGVTNDALYTDSTLAINPNTGKLAWYFQHVRNDQWDLDWAFERQIVRLPVNGRERRLVITAGKPAIYDALDAARGTYVFSIDLGLQNFITAINPKTGVKSIDPALLPDIGKRVTICPYQAAGKEWLPASYNPTTRIVFVPLVEACMDMIPVAKGEPADLSSGINWTLRPRPDSDGKYGRLQAINLETRQTVWTVRQRAPQTSGVLATAGGVVFAGALDRWFTAYDAGRGASLWRIRLSDVPNSAPISYLAGGKQYIAIVVGGGHGMATEFPALVPETPLPLARSSAIWVFALDK